MKRIVAALPSFSLSWFITGWHSYTLNALPRGSDVFVATLPAGP